MSPPSRAHRLGSGERASVRLPALRKPPRIVGRYLVCDAFAAGGMATVHLARLMGPEGFSRTVAIKQLHPQFAHDPKFVAMFLDEARLASRVRHPNVVSPLDVISEPPDLFMVMDYVHGEPLSWLLRRKPLEPVPPRIAAAIIGQVLLGLHAAHVATGERGESLDLVHRDVSPHNILVTQDGVAKVVDFGIAKAKARSQQTERGMLKGKLGYMAPEQINMEAVDRRADIFAVGVVLWELLTGQRLFNTDNPRAMVERPRNSPIEPPSRVLPGLTADLDEVVMAALAWNANERFDNARAMAQALDYSIPAASMLELAAWVESRVGAELAARAELVADVETLSFDDFTRAVRHPLAPHAPSPLETPAPSEMLAEDRIAPAAPKSGRRLRKLWILPVLACALLGVFALWARAQRSAPPRSTGPTVVALPAPPVTVTVAPEPELAPLVEEPAKPPESAALEPSRAPVRPTPKAAPSVQKAPIQGECDIPYTVDKNGVKRFKEACF
jgi:eukaryotic-like serine/threonine-protein kinase